MSKSSTLSVDIVEKTVQPRSKVTDSLLGTDTKAEIRDTILGNVSDTGTSITTTGSGAGNVVGADVGADVGTTVGATRQRRTALACIRCRTRHIRCPGGEPCKKCQLAKTKCEYVEADKKIVVSMKYLSKLHDDIARLKKENSTLRIDLNELKFKRSENSSASRHHQFNQPMIPIHATGTTSSIQSCDVSQPQFSNNASSEVINPSLDKHGRLIQSRTGEKVYVGSSSMTLFGLEIQNMVPSFLSSTLLTDFSDASPTSSLDSPQAAHSVDPSHTHQQLPMPTIKRESEILEKEGNAYKITLSKTNTRPGLSINFSLPSFSYAMLLVDTFINYNDGCFYFFNEGLVKQFLTNVYSGKMEENKKILHRNTNQNMSVGTEGKGTKKHEDDYTILETIWFCKILLIFSVGEMYLGTESDTHTKRKKLELKRRNKEKVHQKHTLPGAGFFYQASELFTGLFASGAIDNITKDGGIEAMLLYAFYLQVADCTIASYFYFGLALRAALILGWHVDADKENINRFELEHRRRIWWTVYMYERMLSSKAGLPLSFADDSVSTELPMDLKTDLSSGFGTKNSSDDVKELYIFPSADYINNCVTITQINALILSSLYTKQPTYNILPIVSDLVHRLISWRNSLPDHLDVDYSVEEPKISRLIVNLMTEYFQGINLAVRPLLFHFASKKLKELSVQSSENKYIDLTKYSKNVLTLLNASFQASINTIKSIWSLLADNMVALFGWMDREYLFTSATTLILFNASFGVHEATRIHLDHALIIFAKMKRLGNYPAALRRAQLLKLIRVLDFNGVMVDILEKHDDEHQGNLFESVVKEPVNKGSADKESVNVVHNDQDFLQFASGFHATSAEGYADLDLGGMEDLPGLAEEQKLWKEITHEAEWLNVHSAEHPDGQTPNTYHGVFSDFNYN
ncbi:PUT3 [Candida oxycetoniae]|uniref:PUT3 n=1 Tax=Candida oxycetoniae TaxID=497107 RepID=A0AAI9WZ68_9ASCO|nr:PUT3 [Candida oxycetoniae]KAI3405873.2 PUT3 [Candida oxycetoniae]